MDYWDEVMQDDVYLITTDGWVKMLRQPRDLIQDKNLKETPDLTIKKKKYKMNLNPAYALIVARYFAEEQANIDALQTASGGLPRKRLTNTLRNTQVMRDCLRMLPTTKGTSPRPV